MPRTLRTPYLVHPYCLSQGSVIPLTTLNYKHRFPCLDCTLASEILEGRDCVPPVSVSQTMASHLALRTGSASA